MNAFFHYIREILLPQVLNRLIRLFFVIFSVWFGLVYWGLTPQQQPGSYQGGEMMMMKSVFWWRKPEYPEETTDLRQITAVVVLVCYLANGGGILWGGIVLTQGTQG